MIESRRKEIDSAVIDRTIPFRISFPAKRIKLHRYIYSEGTGRGERRERERQADGRGISQSGIIVARVASCSGKTRKLVPKLVLLSFEEPASTTTTIISYTDHLDFSILHHRHYLS